MSVPIVNPPVYMALCPLCKGMAMVVVDSRDLKKSVAKELASAIEKGYVVERTDSEFIRTSWKPCSCVTGTDESFRQARLDDLGKKDEKSGQE